MTSRNECKEIYNCDGACCRWLVIGVDEKTHQELFPFVHGEYVGETENGIVSLQIDGPCDHLIDGNCAIKNHPLRPKGCGNFKMGGKECQQARQVFDNKNTVK